MRKLLLALPLLLATALLLTSPPLAAQDPIAERKAGFDANRKAIAAIKAILDKDGPVTDAAAPAQAMVSFAARIPGLFPPGSTGGNTKAKPAIWENPADFKAKADAFAAAAAELTQAATANDRAALAKAFATTAATCQACHAAYRQ